MNYSLVDPIFVLAKTKGHADDWVKDHVHASHIKPVGVSCLNQLRGVRGKLIIILPSALQEIDVSGILNRNTIVRISE